MDAGVIHQYRFLLVLLAAGLVLGFVAGFFLSRSAPAASQPEPPIADAGAQRQLLPHVMLLLVALAVSAGTMLLIPAAMVLRFFFNVPVLAAVLLCTVLLGAPLLYAWRARPFS